MVYPERKRLRIQPLLNQIDVPPPPKRPRMNARLKHQLICSSTIEILTHSWKTRQEDGTFFRMWLEDLPKQPITPFYVPQTFDILGEKLGKAFLLEEELEKPSFLPDLLFDDTNWKIDAFEEPLPESLELKPLFGEEFLEVLSPPPPPPPHQVQPCREAIADQLENSQHSPTHTPYYETATNYPPSITEQPRFTSDYCWSNSQGSRPATDYPDQQFTPVLPSKRPRDVEDDMTDSSEYHSAGEDFAPAATYPFLPSREHSPVPSREDSPGFGRGTNVSLSHTPTRAATPLYLESSPHDCTPTLRRHGHPQTPSLQTPPSQTPPLQLPPSQTPPLQTPPQQVPPRDTTPNRDPRVNKSSKSTAFSILNESLVTFSPTPTLTPTTGRKLTPRQRIVEYAAQKMLAQQDNLDSLPMDIDDNSKQRMSSTETIKSSELDGEVLDGEDIDDILTRKEQEEAGNEADELLSLMPEEEEEELEHFPVDIDSPDEFENEEDNVDTVESELQKSQISLFRQIVSDSGEVTRVLYFRKSKFRITGTAQHELDKMRLRMDYKDACRRSGLPDAPNKQPRPCELGPGLSERMEKKLPQTRVGIQRAGKKFGVPLTGIARQLRAHDKATALKVRSFGVPLRQIKGPFRQSLQVRAEQHRSRQPPQRGIPPKVPLQTMPGGHVNRHKNFLRNESLLSAFCPCWVQRPFHDIQCAHAHDDLVEIIMARQQVNYSVVKSCIKEYFLSTSARSGDLVKDFLLFKNIINRVSRGSVS